MVLSELQHQVLSWAIRLDGTPISYQYMPTPEQAETFPSLAALGFLEKDSYAFNLLPGVGMAITGTGFKITPAGRQMVASL